MGFLQFISRLFTKPSGGGNGGGKDKTLRCAQCHKDFVFKAGEREFYQQRGLQEPKRCPTCRRSRSGFRRRRR